MPPTTRGAAEKRKLYIDNLRWSLIVLVVLAAAAGQPFLYGEAAPSLFEALRQGEIANVREAINHGAGVLSLVMRCPDQVLGACHTSYRLSVPDNVPVTVRTSSGAVRLSGVRASVRVNTGSGSITAGPRVATSADARHDAQVVRSRIVAPRRCMKASPAGIPLRTAMFPA